MEDGFVRLENDSDLYFVLGILEGRSMLLDPKAAPHGLGSLCPYGKSILHLTAFGSRLA
jgi:hypothetical protein